uniref:Uncharacterized protein n=1 Tax=Salix viminalis TaxID=40686 RepID=A0A6N2KDG1_SALVM
MRTCSPSLPLLVFCTILLALLHSSTCRHISWANYEEKQQINTEYPLPFPQYDLPESYPVCRWCPPTSPVILLPHQDSKENNIPSKVM